MPLLVGVVVLTSQGCAQKQPAEKPAEHTVRKVTPEAATGGTNTDPETKEQFERALNMKIERLDEEIRELQAKVGSLKDAAKAKWTEKMAEVTVKREAAEAKRAEVQKSAEGAWEHLREGADRAWQELEQAVEKAQKKF
jgi:chromosome segregation ATPase